MTTDRDDASTRRYREASAALDERPSAATRAAILAAAARHVEAKPRAADAPRAAHRRRWPLATAAAVLLSTLAVMLAQRTEQEMPTFMAPAERAQERVAVAPAEPAPATDRATGESQTPPPAPPASASPPQPSAKNEVRADSRAGALEPGARTKKSAPAGAADDPESAASRAPESRDEAHEIPAGAPKSRAQAAPEPETASSEARRAFPAAPAAAPPPPAVEKPTAESGAAGSASDAAKAAPSPAYRAARKEVAPAGAPAAQGAVRQETQRDVELSAQDWLDRIVKLRGEGRHADADADLKRFRERYPGVRVPTAALPPSAPASGTR